MAFPSWPKDQVGASNYITPQKVVKAVQLVKTGQIYELEHIYVLDSRYEVTLADVRGALARQNVREDSIEPGDAILFNYGWAVNWNNPAKYNDSRFGVGENNGSPGIGIEVARSVPQRKASMVGADSCCVQVSPALQPNAAQACDVALGCGTQRHSGGR